MHKSEFRDAAGRLLAVKVSPLVWEEAGLRGARFLTDPGQEMQVGLLHHPPGHAVPAHWHPPQERAVRGTSEVLVVIKGRVKVTLFADGYEYQAVWLAEGDLILLVAGGHSLEVLDDAFLWEIKQGPYHGVKADKLYLGPDAGPGREDDREPS